MHAQLQAELFSEQPKVDNSDAERKGELATAHDGVYDLLMAATNLFTVLHDSSVTNESKNHAIDYLFNNEKKIPEEKSSEKKVHPKKYPLLLEYHKAELYVAWNELNNQKTDDRINRFVKKFEESLSNWQEDEIKKIARELMGSAQYLTIPPSLKLQALLALRILRCPELSENVNQALVVIFDICNRYQMPAHIFTRLQLFKLSQGGTDSINHLHNVLHKGLFPDNGVNIFDPENPACKILEAQTEMLEACKKFRNTDQNAVDFEANRQAAIIAIEECESICLTTPISNKLQRAALAVCAAVAAFFIGFAIGAAAGAWTGPAAIFTGLAAGLYAAIGVVAGSAVVGVATYAALRHTSLFAMPFEDQVKPVIEELRAELRL